MIHTYSLGGYNIAVDVNSGAVHALSNCAYDVLNILEPPLDSACPENIFKKLTSYSHDEIKSAYDELYNLYKEGMLFADDDYIDIKGALPENAPLKALCLHIAHDCNLRCKYCFASTGDFGTGRKLMPFEVAKAAIDFVIKRSMSRRNIEIDFFGGEPLMGFETVRKTVEYAKEQAKIHGKHFRFTLTTNGVLLNDEIIEYINREMSNVVLSLDGRPEVNDAVRPAANGKGSYDIIVPKFKKLVDNRDKSRDYYVRGTFTRDNIDFTNDVLHIADLGFSELSIEPVVAEAESPYSLREEDFDKICAEYDKLSEIMKERKDFRFFHFLVDLDQGPCIIKRVRGCGAGYEYAAISPEGDVYPCHQFVGKPEYLMGNVLEDTLDKDISKKFMGQNVFTRKECRNCWAKYYCSGGCSAANLNMNNDLSVPYEYACRLERKRLECAIILKVHESLNS